MLAAKVGKHLGTPQTVDAQSGRNNRSLHGGAKLWQHQTVGFLLPDLATQATQLFDVHAKLLHVYATW